MSQQPSTSSVSSRFVSSKDLEAAQEKRQEEWRKAYERIGQEPPPAPAEDEKYDPRSLWEKLQEHKTKKQEAFEEQLKFKNHFRALDEEEISFLDSMIDENNEEETERQRLIKQELEGFRKAVTARSLPPPPPTIISSSSTAIPSTSSSSSILGSTSSSNPKITSTSSSSNPSSSSTSITTTTTVGGNGTGGGVKKGKKLKGLPGLVVKKTTKKSQDSTPTTTTAKPKTIESPSLNATATTASPSSLASTTSPTSNSMKPSSSISKVVDSKTELKSDVSHETIEVGTKRSATDDGEVRNEEEGKKRKV